MTTNGTPTPNQVAPDGESVAPRDRRDRSVPELVYIAVCLITMVVVVVVWLA